MTLVVFKVCLNFRKGDDPVPTDMSSAGVEYQDLDKIGCARQFESELSLHSLALFL